LANALSTLERPVPPTASNFNPRSALKLDFKNDDRAPLLLIAGGSDHVVPASIDKATSEIADYALDWAVEHAQA
jgi:alpha-beta hydrolase superfamily lysophospholipase